MSRNLILWLIIAVAIGTGSFLYLREPSVDTPVPFQEINDPSNYSAIQKDTPVTSAIKSENSVSYTDDGFVPSVYRVKKGQVVTFVNESSKAMWPASDEHPTHRLYPQSDIKKCAEQEWFFKIFDACGEIIPGLTWAFKFEEGGSWKYHNHRYPSHTGTVVVE